MEKVIRIIFLGPPGSGKGTQSAILCQKFGMVPLSTGDMLRRNIEQKTALGLQVEKIMEEGLLVSDDLMNTVIEARLFEEDCIKKGFLLDGYPRTLRQACALEDMLAKKNFALTRVFLFEIDDTLALQRIKMRAKDDMASSGKIRTDDSDGTISQKRLRIYREQSQALIDYYQRAGLLTKIDATYRPHEVTNLILQAFSNGMKVI